MFSIINTDCAFFIEGNQNDEKIEKIVFEENLQRLETSFWRYTAFAENAQGKIYKIAKELLSEAEKVYNDIKNQIITIKKALLNTKHLKKEYTMMHNVMQDIIVYMYQQIRMKNDIVDEIQKLQNKKMDITCITKFFPAITKESEIFLNKTYKQFEDIRQFTY